MRLTPQEPATSASIWRAPQPTLVDSAAATPRTPLAAMRPGLHGLGSSPFAAPETADVIRPGGPDANGICSDDEVLDWLTSSVDEPSKPEWRERIEAVPTRLTLEARPGDVAIKALAKARSRFVRLRTYLRIGSRQAPLKTEGLASGYPLVSPSMRGV